MQKIRTPPFHLLRFSAYAEAVRFFATEKDLLLPPNSRQWERTVQNARVRLQQKPEWYGTPFPQTLTDLSQHQTFLRFSAYEKLKQRLAPSLQRQTRAVLAAQVPDRRLAYNDRGLGVFSFDRAAMGLHRVKTPRGQFKFQSSVKTVFGYFPPRPRQKRALRLFVNVGANANVSGEALLYSGLGVVLLAERLLQKGLAVEISALLASQHEGKQYAALFPLKRFEESLDLNALLLQVADPRFFRFQGFYRLIATYNAFGAPIPPSLGSFVPLEKLRPQLQALYPQEPLLLFGNVYTPEALENQLSQLLDEFAQSAPSQSTPSQSTPR